jgi:hypothetical protein
VSDPGAMESALGDPEHAGIQTLHRGSDLCPDADQSWRHDSPSLGPDRNRGLWHTPFARYRRSVRFNVASGRAWFRKPATSRYALLAAGIAAGCASTATNSTPPMGSPDAAGSDAAVQADGASPGSDAVGDVAIDSRPIGDAIAEPAVDASTVMDAGTVLDASILIDVSALVDAGNEADAGGSPCANAAACRTFSNYCGGCTCQALGTSEPDPPCDAGTVTCLLDPCRSHTAACDPTGHCTLR